jgi:hypothetical protein
LKDYAAKPGKLPFGDRQAAYGHADKSRSLKLRLHNCLADTGVSNRRFTPGSRRRAFPKGIRKTAQFRAKLQMQI